MYYNDATMNGLHTDRHVEEKAVELFAANIMKAGQSYLDNPMETPFIPNWSRIQAADPDVLLNIHKAVQQDAQEFG
jgi:glucosyl-3-phosphoglycerate synthase